MNSLDTHEEKFRAATQAFDGWAKRLRDFLDSSEELSKKISRETSGRTSRTRPRPQRNNPVSSLCGSPNPGCKSGGFFMWGFFVCLPTIHHAGLKFHQCLVDGINSDQPRAGVVQVKNDVNGKRQHKRKQNGRHPDPLHARGGFNTCHERAQQRRKQKQGPDNPGQVILRHHCPAGGNRRSSS